MEGGPTNAATNVAERQIPIPNDFPPVVYLPCTSHVVKPADAEVEMRRLQDGRMCLLTYSALDRLKRCCGQQQPWLVMPTTYLGRLQQAHPFELLLLDVVIPEEQRSGVPNG